MVGISRKGIGIIESGREENEECSTPVALENLWIGMRETF